MKWVLLISLLVLAGCSRESSECKANTDCYQDEVCQQSECVKSNLGGQTCDLESCASELTERTTCLGERCVVVNCQDGAVFCSEGCCPPTASEDYELDLGSEQVASLDIELDAFGRPSIFWYDFTSFELRQLTWDGQGWNVSIPAIFPEPSWDFDAALNESGRGVLVYVGLNDTNLYVATQNERGGWDSDLVQEALSIPETETDPVFLRPKLSIQGDTPVACYMYGNEDEFFYTSPSDTRPQLFVAELTRQKGWLVSELDGPVATECSVGRNRVDSARISYSVWDEDGFLQVRFAEKETEETVWLVNQGVTRSGSTGGRDSLLVGADGSTRIMYSLGFQNPIGEVIPTLAELVRVNDGAAFEETVIHEIDGSGPNRAFGWAGYEVMTDGTVLKNYLVNKLDDQDFRAVWYTDDPDNAEQIQLQGPPDFYQVTADDRFHVAYIDLRAKKLYYHVR